MRTLHLIDGTQTLINDADDTMDVELTRLIAEKLGRDTELFCKDVLENVRDKVEADALDYMESRMTFMQSRIDAILSHWKDYLKLPDALEAQLQSLRGELREITDNYYFVSEKAWKNL